MVAEEASGLIDTKILSSLFDRLLHLDGTHSAKYELTNLVPLDPTMCLRLQMIGDERNPTQGQIGTPIAALNTNSLDAAIGIGERMPTGEVGN